MSTLEMIFYIFVGLTVLAFSIRILVESWKIIYAMAPIIIAIIFCVLFVIVLDDSYKEIGAKDANHIGSTKN